MADRRARWSSRCRCCPSSATYTQHSRYCPSSARYTQRSRKCYSRLTPLPLRSQPRQTGELAGLPDADAARALQHGQLRQPLPQQPFSKPQSPFSSLHTNRFASPAVIIFKVTLLAAVKCCLVACCFQLTAAPAAALEWNGMHIFTPFFLRFQNSIL